MSHRKQKEYLDELEEKLRARYGYVWERNQDTSRKVLSSFPHNEKQEEIICEAAPSGYVSDAQIYVPKLQPDSTNIKYYRPFNHNSRMPGNREANQA